MNFNAVYNMDCINGIRMIKNNTIDMTITSPPYNLGIKYDEYNDNMNVDDYIDFISEVCNELHRVVKDGGRVAFNVPPDIGILKNNSKISLDSLFYNCLSDSGFYYRTKILWNKNTITSRTAWGSFMSPSNPNILPPFEYILVFYKNTPKKVGNKDDIDITREEFIEWTNGLWNIASESKRKIGHPAPYPKELCKRLIKMFTYKSDVILDPFVGSGTTCVVAKELDRKYIGFDVSKSYIELTNKRLLEVV